MYFMRALFDFLTEFSIFDAPDPVNRFEVRGLRKFTLGNNSVESPRCTDKV